MKKELKTMRDKEAAYYERKGSRKASSNVVPTAVLLQQLADAKKLVGIAQPKPVKSQTVSTYPTPTLPVAYDDVKFKLFEIATQKAKEKHKTLNIEPINAAIWRNVLKWAIYDTTGAYDVRKSILIFGKTGTGKTFLAECIKQLLFLVAQLSEEAAKDCNMGFVNCLELFEKVRNEGGKAPNLDTRKKYYHGHWIFDDLGEENGDFNHYGNRYTVLSDIIRHREKSLNVTTLNRAIFTTNLIPILPYKDNEFVERYGDRIWSRFQNICPRQNWAIMQGQDKRI